MDRAAFCRRMMPALQLAAKQGYIRNDPRTRKLLGYADGQRGSCHLGNRLCEWAKAGVIIAASPKLGPAPRLYRLTSRGRLAIETNAHHAQRHTLSAQLVAFFEANDGEELTRDDICAKYGVTRAQAMRAIAHLVATGRAERVTVVRPLAQPVEQQRRAA